jgi:hypothetical protein
MMQQSQLLERFHQALVQEIRQTRPEYLHSSFTVAEIYQNLIPYRSHRDAIGVQMNGDYEAVLLRLLAGEGDFLTLESEPARREIQNELLSTNPNVGLFREFAAVDVRLNPDRLGEAVVEPAEAEDSLGFPSEAAEPPVAPEPPAAGLSFGEDPSPAAPVEPTVGGASCPGCREALPDRSDVRFCPACGVNVRAVDCAACGRELERGWRFCAACGAATAS